jgi:hypothetical protein
MGVLVLLLLLMMMMMIQGSIEGANSEDSGGLDI